MNRIIRIVAMLLVITNFAVAQGNNSGEIYGRITDEKGESLDAASVSAYQGGVLKGGKRSDLNGNYIIKPLAPGTYNVKVTFLGYPTQEIQGVVVRSEGRTKIDVKMEKAAKKIGGDDGVVIKQFKNPLISEDGPVRAIGKKEILQGSTRNASDLASMQGGGYQRKTGAAVNLGGDRSTGTMYMIDGIMVRGSRATGIPQGGIENLEVSTNGLSAKFGNATGGVIQITTSSIKKDIGGNISLQHSVEGYNNNLMSVELSGPLLKVKRAGQTYKKPVIGFGLNLQAKYDVDGNPFIQKYYRVKPSKLQELQTTPLMPNPNGNLNFVRTGEMITMNDLEQIKARENGQVFAFDYVGKLDFQPVDNINFTVGFQGNYTKGKAYSFSNSLFAPEANSIGNDITARGYARLTHRLGKSGLADKKTEKFSPISNAFYTLQFTYQKEYSYSSNPDHGRNIFNYGYLGKFITHTSPAYTFDTALNANFLGIKYLGQRSDSVTFIPAGKNPLLENYTNVIYNNSDRFPVRSINNIQSYGGLRNGDAPASVYGLWTAPGAQIGSYSYSQADQATLNLDASFNIDQGGKKGLKVDKITHNIQFGIGYDQRTSRSYALRGLWNLMRLNTNKHILNLDVKNPKFIVGGQDQTAGVLNGTVNFSPFDTIQYDQLYVSADQSRFDKELRKKLYGSETNLQTINVDALDPSTFSLDMFNATELFNSGEDAVSYFGYDYLGNKIKKQPSFKDFWTKKDARGDYSRPIGAFRPIYMFGYVLDKFTYKTINFNIGMRVDRYDANQKVLKDQYSLYAVKKVGDIKEGTYNYAYNVEEDKYASSVSNFDKDYVAYVNNSKAAKPTIVGYRKGDIWYDPFGKVVDDPTILSGLYADGLPIQPWLQNNKDSIKSKNFNPDNSFEDYKPQLSLSPRIKFTFPISDEALFYGNYDIVTQTPSSNIQTTPDDYYFLAERGATINNGNLKMEKAINYSFGYQQKLSKLASITLEAYYRERKNQIQLQRLLLAYPISYQTYGNRDFSTTKGFTARLDFRRIGPIRMDINYTLQFAEGTGSNTTSQSSLLATGQPNLRTVFPLDIDSRHILNATLDYRYEEDNKGPKVGNCYPFSNSGINFLFRARSGEPYTRSALATPVVGGDFNSTPIIGTINGSRLPWNSELAVRIDKSIMISPKVKGADGKKMASKSPLYLNVYCQITNILNTRNILSVYGYTGLGDDDGYLTSPQGLSTVKNNYQFQQSFIDMYRTRIASPGSFNNPRIINFGFSLDF